MSTTRKRSVAEGYASTFGARAALLLKLRVEFCSH
jgi:hypothetical protein